jgi:protein SCO1/2
MRNRLRMIGVAAFFASAACGNSREETIKSLHGVKFAPPHAKTDFTLEDTQGKPFHFKADTKGTVTLLYFGYTYCPDVCPLQLQNIAAAMKQMTPAEQAQVKVIFVTTDPNRDTPERLRSWLDNFDKRFIGLRGGLDSVNTRRKCSRSRRTIHCAPNIRADSRSRTGRTILF